MAQITSNHLNPLPPGALNRLLQRAAADLDKGQFGTAASALAKVLALDHGNLEAIRLTGIAARLEKDYPTAINCLRQVYPSRPDDGHLNMMLGITLYESGDMEAAVTHLRRATALIPDSALPWSNLGEALRHQSRSEEAIEALQHAARLDPSNSHTQVTLARLHSGFGRIDQAIELCRAILSRDPSNVDAWFELSNFNSFKFDAKDTARMREAYQRGNLPDEAQSRLGFAFAKALEDQGQYEDAFDVFHAANRRQRARAPWNAATARAQTDATIASLGTWLPPAPNDAQRGREVIFIASLPRSGSTLVEQILASHPEIEGANEISDLPALIDAETKRQPLNFPNWVSAATAADWQRMGTEYLARTAKWRQHKPRFTDKNLATWHLIGPTLAMLPAARVVVVRRDPVETCMACYRQWLGGTAPQTYDLDDMADSCIDFMRLTRFWLQRFPERVLDLEYETLVAQPEATIRHLLDFCELPFDLACLSFYKTKRNVRSTPSAAQVRQPLRSDTARTDRYGHKLDGLRARLRAAGLTP